MRIAVASPLFQPSLTEALQHAETLITTAALQKADIICFPESYLPGYPVEGQERKICTESQLRTALDEVCRMAATHSIAIVMPMDWYENGAFLNVAQVVSKSGERLGYQTKNQLDPSEDKLWQAGTTRHIFEVDGVKFGVTICHEGFRYPESVRWAARQGAKIVFHPHFVGSNQEGPLLKEWGHKDNPYYEKAQMMRALENTIYFAPSNYTVRYPHSASAIIAPDGRCMAHQAYGEAGVTVADIDPEAATGFLAKRFKAQLYTNG